MQATVAQTPDPRAPDVATPAPPAPPAPIHTTPVPPTPPVDVGRTADLQAFVDAYANHPMWATFDPILGSIDVWRDKAAAYVFVGKIVGSRVETRPWEPLGGGWRRAVQ